MSDETKVIAENLRSPYPELSDSEYRHFVELWGYEDLARDKLEQRCKRWGNLNAIEYLRRFRRPGLFGWIDRWFHTDGKPLWVVYDLHHDDRHGIYS